MLLIGTVLSLVTAVAATRAMLGLLAGFRWFDNPRFMGANGAADRATGCRSTSCGRRDVWFADLGDVVDRRSASSRSPSRA